MGNSIFIRFDIIEFYFSMTEHLNMEIWKYENVYGKYGPKYGNISSGRSGRT